MGCPKEEPRVNRLRVLFLLVGTALLTGCVFVQSSTTSDTPPSKNAPTVRVIQEGDLGVLHLTSPKDLTSKANASLLAQCPSGRLVNVQTQLSDRDYFWIVQDYKLRVEGECLPVRTVSVPKAAPVAKIPPSELKKTRRGLIFTLGSLLFETNSALIRKNAQKHLVKLAAFLKNDPVRRIMIEGYTDNTGLASRNQILSEKRARSVEAILLKLGVPQDRIARVKGYGALYPVASNQTVRGREKNRRVEIVISNPQGAFKKNR